MLLRLGLLPCPQLWLGIGMPPVAGHGGWDEYAWTQWWYAPGAIDTWQWRHLDPFACVAVAPWHRLLRLFVVFVGAGRALRRNRIAVRPARSR